MAELRGQDGDPGGHQRELPGDDGGEIRWFRFVRQEDRAAYEAQGWAFAADLGPVHGCYSVLMERVVDLQRIARPDGRVTGGRFAVARPRLEPACGGLGGRIAASHTLFPSSDAST